MIFKILISFENSGFEKIHLNINFNKKFRTAWHNIFLFIMINIMITGKSQNVKTGSSNKSYYG